jgi:hypothetical protein
VPGESTLLQILISIQAMVLCENPWYNEPGHENTYGRVGPFYDVAASYHQGIRQETINIAILGWLVKLPPLWKDVINQHFTANADRILLTAVEWSKAKVVPYHRINPFAPRDNDNDQHAITVNTITHSLQRLQKRLQKYGASQNVPKDYVPPAEENPETRFSRLTIKPQFWSSHYQPASLALQAASPEYGYLNEAGPSSSKSAQVYSLDDPGFYYGMFGSPSRPPGSGTSGPSGKSAGPSVSGGRGGFNVRGRSKTMSSIRGRGGTGGAAASSRGMHSVSGQPSNYYPPRPSIGSGPSGRGGCSREMIRDGAESLRGVRGGRGRRGQDGCGSSQ